VTQNGDTILANKMILATGHSARDIFELLDRKKIFIEAKAFALGVSGTSTILMTVFSIVVIIGETLPPAPYSIVKQVGAEECILLYVSRRCNRAMQLALAK
jgi:hypothetical protein